MSVDTTAATGAQGQLAFSDAAGAAAWLARLPAPNSAECHAELATQAARLLTAPVAPAAKLEILELMRHAVAAAQSERARECRDAPVPLEPKHLLTWQSVVGLWRALADNYESLIDAMATSAPNLAAQAHLICQRALRCTALAMIEHWRVHYAVSGVLWQQLHRLYVFSENAGISTKAVNDAVGRGPEATSCAGSYAHALLLHLAHPDSLTSGQLGIVDRWLERWEGLLGFTPEPLAQSSIPALAVDVASRKGAGLAKDMPSAGVRHLNMETISKTLRQTAELLKKQPAAELGLGDLSREACEQLLVLLQTQWCAAGTGRVDERTPASLRVQVSPNLASIHFHITGKAFRQPRGTGKSAAEREGPDTPDQSIGIVSQRSAALETWEIRNQSVSGFLATCHRDDVVHPLAYHQLVGLLASARKTIYTGVVQRLVLDEEGTIWIGLRIIRGVPQAASARIAEGTGKYDRALLMPQDATRDVPPTILLLPGWYKANRNLVVRTDKEEKIRLLALRDRGPNFERAAFSAAEATEKA